LPTGKDFAVGNLYRRGVCQPLITFNIVWAQRFFQIGAGVAEWLSV
jgi:hypothetical protein